jgi:hypothetical protein
MIKEYLDGQGIPKLAMEDEEHEFETKTLIFTFH